MGDGPGGRVARAARVDDSPTQAAVSPSERDVWLVRRGFLPEIRSRSRKATRITAWLTVAILVVGGTLWAINSWRLLDPCTRVDVGSATVCRAPAAGIRTTQFVIAVLGLAAAGVALVYVVHIGMTGRTFRRWRHVALTFSGLVLLWLAVWAIGALSV